MFQYNQLFCYSFLYRTSLLKCFVIWETRDLSFCSTTRWRHTIPNFSQFSGLYVKLLNRFEFVMITQFFIVILFFVFSNYFYFSYDRLFIYCDFYNCCDSFFISCCCGSCGWTFKHFLMNTNTLFLRILTR